MCSLKEEVLHDRDLCRRAQAGDAAAHEAVFAGSQRLIASRIAAVIGESGHWPANVSLADAEQEGRLALFCALRAWDGRRPLTTLAVTCIDRQLRRWRAKTFPVLHVSRAAYTAAHGHFPGAVSLDDGGDGDRRPLGGTIADTSVWGSDPLLLVEAKERVAEVAAIARARPEIAEPRPARSRQSRSKVILLHRWISGWCSMGWDFAAPQPESGPTRSPRTAGRPVQRPRRGFAFWDLRPPGANLWVKGRPQPTSLQRS